MSIVDTHAHLYLDAFEDDLDEVVARAGAVGVEKVLLPNIDETTIQPLRSSVDRYPSFFLPMMGLHPTNVGEEWEEQLEIIRKELERPGYVAIGEIGIDLYWDKARSSVRWPLLNVNLNGASKRVTGSHPFPGGDTRGDPVDQKRWGERELFGVFHSFGGTVAELEAILELGNFLIGINGVVTFKKSGLPETLKGCGVENHPGNRFTLPCSNALPGQTQRTLISDGGDTATGGHIRERGRGDCVNHQENAFKLFGLNSLK